jgi:P4 family phage/plasmid primase-like protien
MNNIPSNLKSGDFRFVLINNKQKAPFEKSWQKTANYTYDNTRLQQHITNNNYGVLGGYGNLLIIDFDDKEFQDKYLPQLPDTFTVQTGSGGLHLYYNCDDPTSFKVMNQTNETLADIQGRGKQVVGPNSTHPNGNIYKVIKDIPIAKITIDFIRVLFADYIKDTKIIGTQQTTTNPITETIRDSVSIIDVMRWYNYDTSKNPTVCMLGHNSNNKQNFSYNESKGLWNCFHCNKGGDVFKFVMEHEGCDFLEARRKLAEHAGIKLQEELKTQENNQKVLSASVTMLLASKQRRSATESLTQAILSKYNIYTIREDDSTEMWMYQNGIYVPKGKSFIKEFCREVLGEAYTTHIANEVIMKIEADTYIDADKFFNNNIKNEVAVNNGILNVVSQELTPFTPKKIYFNKLQLTYQPCLKCPHIIQFFNDILKHKEDITIMQELFGYLLYKENTFEVSFMLSGGGRNGKGKTVELMKRLLGLDNICNLPIQQFERDNYAVGELLNKMANLAGDIDSTTLKETGTFKMVTGRDPVSAARKFLTRITFVPFAKMIFCANQLPRTYDMTEGFWSRWILIEYPYTFVDKEKYDKLSSEELINVKIKDPNIIDKIATKEELSGLLNWALEGLTRLLQRNSFSYSKNTDELKNMWVRKADSFSAFIMDCLEEEYENYITKKDLRRAYANYCKQHKVKVCSDKYINAAFAERGIIEERKNVDGTQLRVWDGVALKSCVKRQVRQDRHGISTLIQIKNSLESSNMVSKSTNLSRFEGESVNKDSNNQLNVEEVYIEDEPELIHHKCHWCKKTPCQFWSKTGKPLCKECNEDEYLRGR